MLEILNNTWNEKLKRENSVVLVGASGAGKSSIFSGLSSSPLNSLYSFPKRYTTRKNRTDDMHTENITISDNSFKEKILSKSFEFSWKKPLPLGDVFYGFLNGTSTSNIYCCNNELIEFKETIVGRKTILEDSLIIQIFCSLKERRNRLLRRSPELLDNLSELEYRLKEVKEETFFYSDLVIHNENAAINDSINCIYNLLL